MHMHNLHGGYFDLRELPYLTHRVPTVITLHDAWMLTGHCAHWFDCDRWRTGCGECPHLDTHPALLRDKSAFNWRRKRGIYERSDLRLATPAQWLADRIGESMLGVPTEEIRVIPQGIDLAVFRPGDRSLARRELGLDDDLFVALFVGNLTRLEHVQGRGDAGAGGGPPRGTERAPDRRALRRGGGGADPNRHRRDPLSRAHRLTRGDGALLQGGGRLPAGLRGPRPSRTPSSRRSPAALP